MKRYVIVSKLIAEGLSEKTLVNLSDNQLLSLAERMLGEQNVGMKISKKDPQYQQKVADAEKQGKTIETYEQELKGDKKKVDKKSDVKTDDKKKDEKPSSGATSGNSDVRSPTSTDVRSPTRTATSTDAYTSGNVTVTGGAGSGATTTVTIKGQGEQKAGMNKTKSKSGATYNDGKEIDEELIGGQKKLDKNHNGKIDGQDFKILKGQKKDSKSDDVNETNFGKKVTKGHNNIPEFMDSKKLKESQIKKWVKGLVENEKFHSFTSKNEIMELIKVKLTENKGEPSKPDRDAPVREKPTTKPNKPKRENPFEPKHTPKPKALGEDGDTKTAPVKPKVNPSTKPKKENPFEPKHTPKPKALGEEGKKNKMPEFLKFKNLGFKFKD